MLRKGRYCGVETSSTRPAPKSCVRISEAFSLQLGLKKLNEVESGDSGAVGGRRAVEWGRMGQLFKKLF